MKYQSLSVFCLLLVLVSSSPSLDGSQVDHGSRAVSARSSVLAQLYALSKGRLRPTMGPVEETNRGECSCVSFPSDVSSKCRAVTAGSELGSCSRDCPGYDYCPCVIGDASVCRWLGSTSYWSTTWTASSELFHCNLSWTLLSRLIKVNNLHGCAYFNFSRVR